MAYTGTIRLNPNEWTLLTQSDIESIRVQNLSGNNVQLQALPSTGTPTPDGSLQLRGYETVTAAYTLADLWPSIAAKRVYAYCTQYASLSISHA